MKRIFFAFFFLIYGVIVFAQREALEKAFQKFENDAQLKNALSSLYVVETKTGKIIFDKNSAIGLAPGSTQKIVTSAAAYELLGRNFRYKTELGYKGVINSGVLVGDFLVLGSGDPTFGSERYNSTSHSLILKKWRESVKQNGIKRVVGRLSISNKNWSQQIIPGGWVWEDIGNYYGASANVLNWRENTYDLYLKSGNVVGDRVVVVKTVPNLRNIHFESEVESAARGSGDNAYIYLSPYSEYGIITGTIPLGESNFKISGSSPFVGKVLLNELQDSLHKAGIVITNTVDTTNISNYFSDLKIINSILSPSLDSIIYWLNKKSINLYAEALVKTIGFQKANVGSTEKGTELIKQFWKSKGIDERALNILDGSGLSPSNRITTQALTAVLVYAKKQSWYNGFYNSLPEFNGIRMKSGTIKDVKGFAGYHTSSKGVEYAFSFLVNNYNGPTSSLVQKMYQVLNELK